MRVLVAEDHSPLTASGASMRCERMADLALDGLRGRANTSRASSGVVVLESDAPIVHGDEVCRQLAAPGYRSFVLMLRAARAVVDCREAARCAWLVGDRPRIAAAAARTRGLCGAGER
jgi:hypothetical protein